MAKKKLDSGKLEEMRRLVQEGVTPESISKHFKIAVSSVHNYKKMFKEQGLKIPDVRGKRPSDIISTKPVEMFSQRPAQNLNGMSYICLVVNGVQFMISNKARKVEVLEDKVLVEF